MHLATAAEAMYADEHTMFIYDEDGDVLIEMPRTSGTAIEYPAVADIDNDGSAEIVVVSDTISGSSDSPLFQSGNKALLWGQDLLGDEEVRGGDLGAVARGVVGVGFGFPGGRGHRV